LPVFGKELSRGAAQTTSLTLKVLNFDILAFFSAARTNYGNGVKPFAVNLDSPPLLPVRENAAANSGNCTLPIWVHIKRAVVILPTTPLADGKGCLHRRS
jgi:hypothetical protein